MERLSRHTSRRVSVETMWGMETALYVLILVSLGLIVAQVVASRRHRALVLGLAQRLQEGSPTRDVEATLPPMVADFARRNGANLERMPRVASFHQSGEFRARKGGAFRSFQAWQVVALGRAGFLWEARQTGMSPFWVRVLDAYIATEGRLEVWLFGTIPVVKAEGADISLGEAYRYLAELPWVPDAIIGNPDLSWRVTGPTTVEVRMPTPEGTARVSFGFNEAGDIVDVEARQRPARDPKGRKTAYDWRGRFSDYTWIGDRRVPGNAEVGYDYPSGFEVYFRGRIVDYRLAT